MGLAGNLRTESTPEVKHPVFILLVEDEEVTALMETQQLKSFGYEVVHVRTGEQAIHEVSKKKFDLILMDIDLGEGLNGTDTAEQILAQIDLPIIFLSSHTEPEVVAQTERITSYGYVEKNTGITVLDASVKMALKLFNAKNDQQIAEQAIRQSERKYRNLFSNMLEEVHLWRVIRNDDGDIVNWRLVEVNAAGLKSWNAKSGEVIGKTPDEIWPNGNSPEQFLPMVRELFEGEKARTWEAYFEGTGQTLLMTSVAFEDLFLSTGRDITEIRMLQKRLEDKLQDKEVLLKEVHHRIKNSILSIEDMLEMKRNAAEQKSLRSALGETVGLVSSIRKLYESLLLSDHFKDVSMNAYLNLVLEKLFKTIPLANRVSLHAHIEDVQIHADLASSIGIILNELVSNALLHAFPKDRQGDLYVDFMQKGDRVLLSVKDNGIGVDPKFFTAGKGGFGMNLIEQLCKQLGGSIDIQRNKGIGVRVELKV